MFSKKGDFEKEKNHYEAEASKYIGNKKKTEGLLQQAIEKANDKKGTLGEAWDKLQLLIDLVKAYTKGEYRNVSKKNILAFTGAILYFISPLDLVPDYIVGLGIIDDAAVIGFTFKKILGELDEFKKWKTSKDLT